LVVGFDDEPYGTIEYRDGQFHVEGKNPDAVRHLAEACALSMVQGKPELEETLTPEQILDEMAERYQGRQWAEWEDRRAARSDTTGTDTSTPAPETPA
jgi:hypothetical protein